MPPPAASHVLVKDNVWPKIGYEPHAGQRLIHASGARNRLASCGRRFGKSKLGGSEMVPHALHAYTQRRYLEDMMLQRRYWLVGPNYDDAEREWRVFYDACRKLKMPFDRPGTYNDPHGGNMQMSLWGGRFMVECRSAAHPESLDGEGLDGVIMVEAAKIKAVIWDKFIRPALADKRGWSLHTSTPEGKNHYYEKYKRGQDPNDLEWDSWRMPSWTNDIIFPEGKNDPEILSMRRDMSDERFNQELGADFTDFVGRVFKNFEFETHVRDIPYDPRYPLYAACDYGWTNPFVWLLIQVDVFDNVYVIGEYRVTQRDTNDICRDLNTWYAGLSKKVRFFYPDPAEPGDTEIIRKALGIQPNSSTGGELKHRLEMIRNHLKVGPAHAPPEEQMPKLLIDRSCTGLIYEMEEYKYPEQKSEERHAPEVPMDKDDHGPEALGRFFRGYYGSPVREGRNRVRVTKVKVNR
jgi:hypothetical protein